MTITSRQEFMQAKQRLDSLHISSSFPIQATSIILKLLMIIQKKQKLTTDTIKQQTQIPRIKSHSYLNQSYQISQQQTKTMLAQKIRQLINENNMINRQFMQSNERLQQFKQNHSNCHRLEDKFKRNKSYYQLLLHKNQQACLRQQLNQLKSKYNQLMDLIHQDSNIQKKYLKRLLKHKILQIKPTHQKQSLFYKCTCKNSSINIRQNNNNYNIQLLRKQIQQLKSQNKKYEKKIQNRQNQIRRIQDKFAQQFNVNTFCNTLLLQKRNTQIKSLKNQLQLLLDKLNVTRISSAKSNDYKIIMNNQNSQQRIVMKSPISINILKSPKKTIHRFNNQYIMNNENINLSKQSKQPKKQKQQGQKRQLKQTRYFSKLKQLKQPKQPKQTNFLSPRKNQPYKMKANNKQGISTNKIWIQKLKKENINLRYEIKKLNLKIASLQTKQSNINPLTNNLIKSNDRININNQQTNINQQNNNEKHINQNQFISIDEKTNTFKNYYNQGNNQIVQVKQYHTQSNGINKRINQYSSHLKQRYSSPIYFIDRDRTKQSAQNNSLKQTKTQNEVLQSQIISLKRQIRKCQQRYQQSCSTISQLQLVVQTKNQTFQKSISQYCISIQQNKYLKDKLVQLERILVIQSQEMKVYKQNFQILNI